MAGWDGLGSAPHLGRTRAAPRACRSRVRRSPGARSLAEQRSLSALSPLIGLPASNVIGNALGIMPGRRYFHKKASQKYSGASQKITEAETYRNLGSWIRTWDEPGERANGMCADTGLRLLTLADVSMHRFGKSRNVA